MENKVLPLAEPLVLPEYGDAVLKQIQTGFIGPGEATKRFGDGLAAFAGVEHCMLTVSGTVALSVAAIGLGLVPGDEILVPAYGVISTINGFASIGLTPRLVDIDPATACMDPDKLAQALSKDTKAVCFVNFSGHTGEPLARVADICRANQVPLIEDAACAVGHRFGGRSAGSFGATAIYSFSVPKIITTGQGGAVLTQQPEVFKGAAQYVDHGDLDWRKTNLNRKVGTNLRFNDILASYGLAQLQCLESLLERKRGVYSVLKGALGPRLYQVPGEQAPLHYIVFSESPAELVTGLRAQGVLAARQYRTLSQHPAYAHLAEAAYPGADLWTQKAVYLPFGMALEQEDAQRIVSSLSKLEHLLVEMPS